MRDAVRLALGTLTVVPVRPPQRVDRATAGRAMVLAPLVGLLLGVVVVAVLWLLGGGGLDGLSPLLAAALTVLLLAVLTRGMHLDGLADTTDGLGSGRPADEALQIMRAGDVGPFGVASIVLVLLVQVAALATLFSSGDGPAALALSLVVSRLALPLVCTRGVPAARPDGLGSLVAGTVSRWGLLVSWALALGAAAAAAGLAAAIGSGSVADQLPTTAGPPFLWPALCVVVSLLLGWLLGRRCVRRLGGVTGDVLGACVEVTFTASLVTLALQ